MAEKSISNHAKSASFKHSIPVPDLYKCAKNVLEQHLLGKGSVKNLVFAGRYKGFQKLFTVVQKALDKYDIIHKVLQQLNIFNDHPKLNMYLAIILASEIVERNRDIPGKSKPALTMNSYRRQLIDKIPKTETMEKAEKLPTYVRINVLKITPKIIHEELQNLGFQFLTHDWSQSTYKEYLDVVQTLDKNEYIEDYHIPDLLVFAPQQKFWDSRIYIESLVILQDKASCLPAFICDVHPGMNVIDACAAPGNKTTHLAAIMKNQGVLIAVENNTLRFELLEKLVDDRGATFINTINADFTKIDSNFYMDTELIIVDPSCSSTGTSVHSQKVSEERIKKLAFFQSCVLEHALSFPNVKTVVYSTCSVTETENEEVVEKTLKKFEHSFRLSNLSEKLKEWQHFGSSKYDCGKFCLRTNPSVDKCHGFFIAKFERIKRSENRNCNKNEYSEPNNKNKLMNCMAISTEPSTVVSEKTILNNKPKRKFSKLDNEIKSSKKQKIKHEVLNISKTNNIKERKKDKGLKVTVDLCMNTTNKLEKKLCENSNKNNPFVASTKKRKEKSKPIK